MRRVSELSITYHALKDASAIIRRATAGEDGSALNTVTEVIADKMSQLSRDIVATHPTSPEEIAYKATVVLDWIDKDEPDLAEELAISLCRDILRMFPLLH